MISRIARQNDNLPLAVRIKRTAFAMTMLTILILGSVQLALTLSEIPSTQTKANQIAVDVIGEVLSGDIRNQLGNLRQLSLSSLTWTALTDSAGREAYLKPFLQARSAASSGMPMQLLDYRGRHVLGELPPAVLAEQRDRLVRAVLADKQQRLAVVENEGHPLLLVVSPVVFPYTQDAIGALAGTINLSELFQKRAAGLIQEMRVELMHRNRALDAHPEQPSPSHFPVYFDLLAGEQIEDGTPRLRLDTTHDPWLQPILSRALLSGLIAILLGALVWRVAGILARRTTRRLNRLAEGCAGVTRGEIDSIPDDSATDEIGLLSRTLRRTIAAYAHMNTHLEECVEEKTRELAESETRFRNFFENNASVMLLIEPSAGKIIEANARAVDYFGHAHEKLIGMPVSTLCPKSEGRTFSLDACAEHAVNTVLQTTHCLASGEIRDSEVHLTRVENNGRTLLFCVSHDITERKRAEEKLILAANVFTHAREGIMITAADGTIIDVNEAFTQITGYARDEVLGRQPSLLKSGRHDAEFYAALWHRLLAEGSWYGELWNRRRNGEIYPEMITISAVRDAQGAPRHYVALFTDITTLKAHENQLEHSAHYDTLTKLPNRLLLNDRLDQAMARAQRNQQQLAIVFLDLDGFKSINDRHGHEIGDKVLINVAARMRQTLREGDTLARLGGDEFVALLLDFNDMESDEPTLQRLLDAAAQPICIDTLELQVSASMGITFFPQEKAVTAEQLLHQADQAMYLAKLAGKNRLHVFPAEIHY